MLLKSRGRLCGSCQRRKGTGATSWWHTGSPRGCPAQRHLLGWSWAADAPCHRCRRSWLGSGRRRASLRGPQAPPSARTPRRRSPPPGPRWAAAGAGPRPASPTGSGSSPGQPSGPWRNHQSGSSETSRSAPQPSRCGCRHACNSRRRHRRSSPSWAPSSPPTRRSAVAVAGRCSCNLSGTASTGLRRPPWLRLRCRRRTGDAKLPRTPAPLCAAPQCPQRNIAERDLLRGRRATAGALRTVIPCLPGSAALSR
mmetsp:Transcript_108691/g.317966  ORF Transcript_108691/g.317966 Transcript_108691/m.317966 type:complete len:254 (-) Transcript_108691:165-926(-)